MSDLNAIGAGIGQGLNQAMPALRAEAQDIREAPAKAISMEMAQEQLKKIKSDNEEMARLRTKVTTDQLFSDNPQWKYNLPAFQKAGVLPASKEYSQGDIENAIKVATTEKPLILADSAKNAYNDYDKMANDYAPAVQNAQLQWQKKLENSGPEAPDTLEALQKFQSLKASQEKYVQMRVDASSKFDQAQELFLAKTFSPSSKDKIDENHLLAMAQDTEHPIIAKYAQGILAQKEEAKKKQQDEYKVQEPKKRGTNSRAPYVWIPNEINPVTNQKGVYKSTENNKTPEQNKERLMDIGEKPVTAETESSVNQGIDYLDNIDRLEKRIKPAMTGPIDSRRKAIKAIVANDPEFSRIKQNAGQLIKIAYVLSGKQISEKEMDTLVNKITPQLTNPDENFMATLDELKTMVDRGIRYRVRTLDANGHIIAPDWQPFLSKSGSMVDRSGNPKQAPSGRTVVKTGTDKASGRKVVQYSDGSVEYAQ